MSMELREEARQREEERTAARGREERFLRDLRDIAHRPEGKRFFRWMIDQGSLFADDYQPGWQGAHRAGAKAVSQRLWRFLRQALAEREFADLALGERQNPEENRECPRPDGGMEEHGRNVSAT